MRCESNGVYLRRVHVQRRENALLSIFRVLLQRWCINVLVLWIVIRFIDKT